MKVGADGGVYAEYRGRNVQSLDPASVHLPALISESAVLFGIHFSPTGNAGMPVGDRWPTFPAKPDAPSG